MIYNKIFQDQLNKVTPEIKKEMDWSAVIVKRIEQILKEKGITQRDQGEGQKECTIVFGQ